VAGTEVNDAIAFGKIAAGTQRASLKASQTFRAAAPLINPVLVKRLSN
jgi:hypothetical protein